MKVEFLAGTLADLTVWYKDDPHPYSIREFAADSDARIRLVWLAAQIARAITDANRT